MEKYRRKRSESDFKKNPYLNIFWIVQLKWINFLLLQLIIGSEGWEEGIEDNVYESPGKVIM